MEPRAAKPDSFQNPLATMPILLLPDGINGNKGRLELTGGSLKFGIIHRQPRIRAMVDAGDFDLLDCAPGRPMLGQPGQLLKLLEGVLDLHRGSTRIWAARGIAPPVRDAVV